MKTLLFIFLAYFLTSCGSSNDEMEGIAETVLKKNRGITIDFEPGEQGK